MTREPLLLSGVPSAIQRYGLAVLSVAIALGIGLFLFNFNIQGVAFPLFLIAIAVTVWYAGVKPAIVALVLSTLAFNYYFTLPYYAFTSRGLTFRTMWCLYYLRFWFPGSAPSGVVLLRRFCTPAISCRRKCDSDAASQSAESHSRSDLCARTGRSHHLLEPRGPRVIWVDWRAGGGEAYPGPLAYY